MIVAVIPARGGSKRIKEKNIKRFLNKPIITYPITQIQKSKLFDKIIVSTDNKDISKISKKIGAEILFKRPKKLSNDHASTQEVIIHAAKWLKNNNYKPSIICCIYPTSVFANFNDLKTSFKLFLKKKCNFIISATNYSYPIQRAFYKNKDDTIKMFQPKNFFKRSQDLKKSYHDAAQFYWGTCDAWLNKKNLFDENTKVYLMPQLKVHDIDNIEDWEIAEKIYSINNKKI
jgi:N-acylneuraminate cytidylyltransferase